jgi:hypothetical protein
MTVMISRKRLMKSFVGSLLVLGLVGSASGSVEARKTVPIMSATECSGLQSAFNTFSGMANDARDQGDIEGAARLDAMAANAFARARLGGCVWTGGPTPLN